MEQPMMLPERGQGQTSLGRVTAANRGARPPQQHIKPTEVLRQAFLKMGGQPQQVEQRLNSVAALIKARKLFMVQAGNTVFLLAPKGQGTAELHIASMEPPDVLAGRMKTAAPSVKKMGFNKLYTFFFDPSYIRIAQLSGLPVQVKQGMQRVGQTMKPAYQLEVTL